MTKDLDMTGDSHSPTWRGLHTLSNLTGASQPHSREKGIVPWTWRIRNPAFVWDPHGVGVPPRLQNKNFRDLSTSWDMLIS